jgi:hypothetical protein
MMLYSKSLDPADIPDPVRDRDVGLEKMNCKQTLGFGMGFALCYLRYLYVISAYAGMTYD